MPEPTEMDLSVALDWVADWQRRAKHGDATLALLRRIRAFDQRHGVLPATLGREVRWLLEHIGREAEA